MHSVSALKQFRQDGKCISHLRLLDLHRRHAGKEPRSSSIFGEFSWSWSIAKLPCIDGHERMSKISLHRLTNAFRAQKAGLKPDFGTNFTPENLEISNCWYLPDLVCFCPAFGMSDRLDRTGKPIGGSAVVISGNDNRRGVLRASPHQQGCSTFTAC